MPSKDVRRQEAERLNYEWSLLSNEDKLKELAKRPGQCAKQVAKIREAMNESRR